ncbi:hypothetical protein B0I18_101459 [Taibaiella chishuiensis]|uniref:Uncharacterized protein n=1 Tax=Taibaiella chishuiensis TaxID=1434707 RepID=A0A2P8DAP9_9BACT|nr:hypothetical protein B0I18_101459 [Taibaiella chishuiensis]
MNFHSFRIILQRDAKFAICRICDLLKKFSRFTSLVKNSYIYIMIIMKEQYIITI